LAEAPETDTEGSLGQIAAKTGIPKISLHRYLAPAPAMTQG